MSDQKPTIMVVEDESILLQAISEKMKMEGVETITCTSAEQALDYLGNLETPPDAIWLDYYLEGGGLNGLGFLEELKKNETWAKIPVLVVSNTASSEKVNKMTALGIVDYFVKAENDLGDLVKQAKKIVDR
ncbi:MAG: hypothetical protein ACD_65C00004G0002 [uncultured bacterium]|nr:MAG: hypothetical protein ACD_65C00004G0002 [uncultured bacterium]